MKLQPLPTAIYAAYVVISLALAIALTLRCRPSSKWLKAFRFASWTAVLWPVGWIGNGLIAAARGEWGDGIYWAIGMYAVPVFYGGTVIGLGLLLRAFMTTPPIPGLCAVCGYDLRGNPNADCPECGHPNSTTNARP